MTARAFFVIINVPGCLSSWNRSASSGVFISLSVGWLSGQKQRSVKPSGYALHRFESYPYQKLNLPQGRFCFCGGEQHQLLYILSPPTISYNKIKTVWSALMTLYDIKTKIRKNKIADAILEFVFQPCIFRWVYPWLNRLHLDEYSHLPATLASQTYFAKHPDDIKKIISRLADETSKKIFLKQISFRTGKPVFPYYSNKDTWFPKDIIHLSNQEVFVDCGAFTGDSIDRFLKACKNQYKKIVAFEPSPNTFAILQDRAFKNCTCFKCGVWDKKDTLTFLSDNEVSDKLQDAVVGRPDPKQEHSPLVQVSVDFIDNIPACADTTYLKMDVEGAELNALKGAEKTIRKNHPTLAISIYHSDQDMLEIPLWIMSLGLNYTYFIRQHEPIHTDVVLYAVPNK